MRATLIRVPEPAEMAELVHWMAHLDLQPVTHSRYVQGRLERWFRIGSNLQSVQGGRGHLFRAEEPPPFVAALGDRELPGWHSLLVCGGPTSIGVHVDHQHFLPQAVMLNAGEAEFVEHGREPASLILRDALYLLDIRVPHSSRQLGPFRFHATFRRVDARFLGQL